MQFYPVTKGDCTVVQPVECSSEHRESGVDLSVKNSKLIAWNLGFSECLYLKYLSKIKTNFQLIQFYFSFYLVGHFKKYIP